MIILLLFFCSGATALIYEVIWSKYLALMFGSTIQAQTVVLAVFMGGLALGNWLFGGRADRTRQPLAWYGYLEIAIGLYAFFFTMIYGLADKVYVAVGSPIVGQTGLLLVLKGLLSIVLLLMPTTLMGGTLPLVAAWLQKSSADAGRRSARFYSINSLGAVCGAGLAGFVLVQAMGLPVTLQMTALVNLVIGVIAIGVSRSQGDVFESTKQAPEPSAGSQSPQEASVFRWGCMMVAFTGGVSLGLEVLASRCLSLIFGPSLQSFAIVLMAFILGIGLGGAVIASPRWRHLQAHKASIVLLLIAAVWLGLLIFRMEYLVDLYRHAKTGLALSSMGYRFHQILTAAISIVVLGLPAGLLGAVLPLSIRAISANTTILGDRVGRLLTWNTLGAVVGVLVAGFVLMPIAGLRGSFGTMAVLLALTALLVAASRRQWRSVGIAAVISCLLALVCVIGGQGWRHVMSSGVFRSRGIAITPGDMESRQKNVEILFYEDAADATVSVEKPRNSTEIALRINGKPDASTEMDLATQYLASHLPMMVRPDSKDVFILGFGSGITGGAMLGHPVERINLAENCAPVLRAGKLFGPWNRDVLKDPRVRIWPEDARTVLKLNPQKYDIIISEPSNPWVVGVGSVFSQEYYQLAASKLKPGGIMAQWFHVYEMSDGIVALVLRTFGSVFRYIEIWDTNRGDLLLLGANEPWQMNGIAAVFDRKVPREDLEKIGIKSAEAIWARQLCSQRTAFAVPGQGPVQSDMFPVLEYEAPRAFYIGTRSRWLTGFDERTWQMPLATPAKRAALGALPDDMLKPVFEKHSTSNEDITGYLARRFGEAPADESEEKIGRTFVPCIFRPANRVPGDLNLPAAASENDKRWAQAWALLLSNPDQWAEGIRATEALLQNASGTSTPRDWPLADHAALAAKASLSLGDPQRARNFLALGSKFDPGHLQLRFLSDIMVREGVLQPTQIPN